MDLWAALADRGPLGHIRPAPAEEAGAVRAAAVSSAGEAPGEAIPAADAPEVEGAPEAGESAGIEVRWLEKIWLYKKGS